MTGRYLPLIVALALGAFPAAALAQTSPYDTTPSTTTEVPPTTTATTPTTPPTTSTTTPTTPTDTDDNDVEDTTEDDTTPPSTPTSPSASVAPATTTGTAPSTLAYTGSDVWLVGLIGAFALVGGAALVRSSRRA